MKRIRNKYYENDESQVLYLVTQSKPCFSYKINAVLFNETMLFEYLRLFYAMDLVKYFQQDKYFLFELFNKNTEIVVYNFTLFVPNKLIYKRRLIKV